MLGAVTPSVDPAVRRLLVRVAVAALLVVGVVVLVLAALVSDNDSGADVTVSSNPAVNTLIPARGDEVLQQNRVGVDLDARYRLTSLVIYQSGQRSDGVDVTSQVRHSSGLNLWEFVPGEGRLIEALAADTNCATATYAPIAQPAESGSITWCFEVS